MSATSNKGEANCQGAVGATIGECRGGNERLREVYDQMHSQGPSSWFGSGDEEREMILKMGEPWEGLRVLEIGCGEGDLLAMIALHGALQSYGVDYSKEAIIKAIDKHGDIPNLILANIDYKNLIQISHPKFRWNRLVLQGVLEHLDNPFDELKWMMENLLTEKGDVITSSPCFLNPRGIVWMTLDMLGAVMSKTDLHFLHPWDFFGWCEKMGYSCEVRYCDLNWASGRRMVDDLRQRIPLALRDGKIDYDQRKLDSFMDWLESMKNHDRFLSYGATAVYHIKK